MRRATTPTHKFTFPVDPENFEQILITYAQNNKIILEKNRNDLTIDDYTVYVRLTQEESNLFNPRIPIQVQVRGLTYSGTAVASKIFERPVEEVLNDEILESHQNF